MHGAFCVVAFLLGANISNRNTDLVNILLFALTILFCIAAVIAYFRATYFKAEELENRTLEDE